MADPVQVDVVKTLGASRAVAGDVVRTTPGITHGVVNTGIVELVYLSITTAPQDFSEFYDDNPR